MEINHSYAAGLIDGEGTITLSKNKSSDKFRKPAISVSSTTYELLQFLKNHYGGSISRHKTYQDHHKESWSWKLSYNKAIDFIQIILPYLKEPEKVRRCTLIITEYKTLTPRNGKYTEELSQLKENFEYRFFHPSSAIV